MSAPTAPAKPADPTGELAARLYVELVGRSVVISPEGTKFGTNPENLAKICYKLAETFQRVEAEIKAPSLPKNQEFDLKGASLPDFAADTPG